MNNTSVVLVIILVLGIVGEVYFYSPKTITVEQVGCTEEAKICPDGSSVGRTGPSCTFAACPDVPVAKEMSVVALNEKIFNNGIFITPLEVIADSRCPSDVSCVWAGEVSLKARLEKGTTTADVVFTSQSAIVFETYTVTLIKVIPENNSKTTLNKADYRFTFNVTSLATAATGTISGRVTTSPTCPVERTPQEPQCSPKPYATTIQIREEGKQTIVKTVESNNSGQFTVDLPIGTYELSALTAQNGVLPQCARVIGVVKSGQKTVQDISCDTGIR